MRWTALVPAVACAASVATPAIAGPAAVGTIRSTTGTGAPAAAIPGAVLLAPQPGTGASTVSAGTTMPSLPGVTLIAPQVLVRPLPMPGQNRALIAAGLLQSAAGPAATTPICY